MLLLTAKQIQRELQLRNKYYGEIDGILGPKSFSGIKSALDDIRVNYSKWSTQRIINAYQQAIFAYYGFEVGPIDGLIGPQTIYAKERYQDSLRDIDVTVKEISHQPIRWPRQKDVPDFYGKVGENQSRLILPYPMKLAWDLDIQVNSITLHKKVIPSAKHCFEQILLVYGYDRIKELRLDLFGGSFNVRNMRGGSRYSMHSWGIAIDFDPENNYLRWGSDKSSLARPEYDPFWAIWETEGWVSLGRERNYDWMHVQAARL